MSGELEQRRRNVRVLELLTESYQAFTRGDEAEAKARYEAAFECDGAAATVITGGMRIGEVPRPEADLTGWTEYVEANREALAEAEAESEAQS
jgi:hypothetical protein